MPSGFVGRAVRDGRRWRPQPVQPRGVWHRPDRDTVRNECRRRRQVVRGTMGASRRLSVPRCSVQRRNVGLLRQRRALRPSRLRRRHAERRRDDPGGPQRHTPAVGTRGHSHSTGASTPRRHEPPWRPGRTRYTCMFATTMGTNRSTPGDIAATLTAIRRATPGVPVGISTGDWIVPDLRKRLALIDSWKVLPDFVSVNLHEAGRAGCHPASCSTDTSMSRQGSGTRPQPERLSKADSPTNACGFCSNLPRHRAARASNLRQIEAMLAGVERPRLLHGLGRCAWDLVALAAERGYDTRIGFEDTLRLPDGTRAASNAELVSAACRIVRFHSDHA